MSQPVPPNQPQQPYGGLPGEGNPYAGGQPGQFGGAPFVPAPPARNNIGLGLLTALGAAVVAAVLYGVIAGSIEREFGYAAIGVGLLIGFAASKVGGSNPVIPVVSAVLSLGAVFLGQVICISMILADAAHVGFSELFFDHFSVAVDAWKEEAHFMTYVFLALGPVAAFGGAKRAA